MKINVFHSRDLKDMRKEREDFNPRYIVVNTVGQEIEIDDFNFDFEDSYELTADDEVYYENENQNAVNRLVIMTKKEINPDDIKNSLGLDMFFVDYKQLPDKKVYTFEGNIVLDPQVKEILLKYAISNNAMIVVNSEVIYDFLNQIEIKPVHKPSAVAVSSHNPLLVSFLGYSKRDGNLVREAEIYVFKNNRLFDVKVQPYLMISHCVDLNKPYYISDELALACHYGKPLEYQNWFVYGTLLVKNIEKKPKITISNSKITLSFNLVDILNYGFYVLTEIKTNDKIENVLDGLGFKKWKFPNNFLILYTHKDKNREVYITLSKYDPVIKEI